MRSVTCHVTFNFQITSGCRPCLKNISCLSCLILDLIRTNCIFGIEILTIFDKIRSTCAPVEEIGRTLAFSLKARLLLCWITLCFAILANEHFSVGDQILLILILILFVVDNVRSGRPNSQAIGSCKKCSTNKYVV